MNDSNGLGYTYCNPLPIPSIPVGRNACDPGYDGPWWREFGDCTVLKHAGRWHLYPSCGMLWVSDDFRNWTFVETNIYDVGWAPSVVSWRGAFYLTASGSGEGGRIWRAPSPVGPWEDLGLIRQADGAMVEPSHWCDPDLFVDDDDTLYAYFSKGVNQGLFGVALCGDDPTRFAGDPVHGFPFNPRHVWERFGESNQDSSQSHLEGAHMVKHAGRYYLQYSAAGAEWRNYAIGCYVADAPLGPFRYQQRNPVLIQKGGFLNGCGHHGVVEGPDGALWAFYTILLRRYRGLERRIAMDPVRFDDNGELYIDGPSETPRLLDGSFPADIKPLTICARKVAASSFRDGDVPDCAVDNYARTAWQAESDTLPQWLHVDLWGTYTIASARLIFLERCIDRSRGEAVFQYLLEGSPDGVNWFTVCDRRDSRADGHIRYETWAPCAAGHVRVTITGVPRGSTAGIVDFCVFGNEVMK